MRRVAILITLTLVFAAGSLLGVAPAKLDARQATPVGVTRQRLGGGESAETPGFELVLARRTFALGATTAPGDRNSGPVVLFAEAGTIGFTVVEGAAVVTRVTAGTTAAGTPAPTETIGPGAEAILNQGDSVFYDTGVLHVVRNAGDVEAVSSEARLPAVEETPAAGTAAPSPATGAAPVAVGLSEFAIEMPDSLPAGPTTFEVRNVGAAEHSFEVEGNGIEEELEATLKPGETSTLAVDLQPGTYEVYCPVAGHEDLGMVIELTVTP